jgi:hypothetical protein
LSSTRSVIHHKDNLNLLFPTLFSSTPWTNALSPQQLQVSLSFRNVGIPLEELITRITRYFKRKELVTTPRELYVCPYLPTPEYTHLSASARRTSPQPNPVAAKVEAALENAANTHYPQTQNANPDDYTSCFLRCYSSHCGQRATSSPPISIVGSPAPTCR